ncbi:hypothetical protein D8674_018542 [Pyrus ussuriensis x Pyrus communis]|uniref:Uncharacterized protein n=1 Tax=Pyrus ussuriensis x Pyrus communis TaxID=2448454 RepID=A0A5N5GAG8_9ROSA|nr:hypothetical protein D8674_018542 [Pyrus ussuriensis x Pyrus communis]
MKVSGNPTLSSLFRLHTPPSNPPLSHTSPHPFHLSCSFKPTKPPKPPSLFASTSLPARDKVTDFGKYKGKLLGTLPSAYLKWDRIEWELADNVLNGNRRKTDPASDVVSSTELWRLQTHQEP